MLVFCRNRNSARATAVWNAAHQKLRQYIATWTSLTGLTIANFPAVPFQPLYDLIFQDVSFGSPSDDEALTLVGEFVEELCLNLAAIVFTELIVLDDDVNPGNEGVVEMPDAVCS